MSADASSAVLAARHEAVLERIRSAAEAAGRDPRTVRLVTVTKGIPLPAVRAAYDAGMRLLGESRVQEALAKIAALPVVEWHLVGRLQSNKVRAAARAFATVHSVDSIALLRRLDRVATEEATRTVAYLQFNVTDEPSKGGFDPRAIAEPSQRGDLARAIEALAAVRVAGLMTIGPLVARPDEARPAFARLRELRDALEDELGAPLPELSMGMSGDLEAGVAEGATVVRVGTAIFGLHPH
ncbi:MAG: YggS family pyridoxal phosphate-dependent enzyme [Candidatus Limnocylindria bacterium]